MKDLREPKIPCFCLAGSTCFHALGALGCSAAGDWAGTAACGAQADKQAAHHKPIAPRMAAIRAAKWPRVKRRDHAPISDFVEENGACGRLWAGRYPAIVPAAINLGLEWPL